MRAWGWLPGALLAGRGPAGGARPPARRPCAAAARLRFAAPLSHRAGPPFLGEKSHTGYISAINRINNNTGVGAALYQSRGHAC